MPNTSQTPPAAGLKFTPHPMVDRLIPPLSLAEQKIWLARPGGFEKALEYWKQHEGMIAAAEEDPLRKGFDLAFWKAVREFFARKDELYALGGNGSSKTELGGKLVCETLAAKRGVKVLCVATNDNASKQLQQPAVYKYLPVSARGLNERTGPRRRSIVTKINYSQGGGFTEGTFVLPNGSQCWFKTVEQYERDKTSFEGPEYDLVWIDEPAPIALVDTLSYRVGKRAGKFLFTFTAVMGFDAVCNSVLTGATILKSLPMNYDYELGQANPAIEIPGLNASEVQVKGCPPGHMPFMMQPTNPARGVVFMWTHWNVFLPRAKDNPVVPEIFNKVRGKSKQTVRTRLFGWADKVSGCQFPQFSSTVHVVPPERLPRQGTVYMSGDPATARSYFLLWCVVDPLGRKFVFAESPTMEEGQWVTEEEEKGDGQFAFGGRGPKWYKRYIRTREAQFAYLKPAGPLDSQAEPAKRFGDPRGFAAAAAADEGNTTLFEKFLEEGDDELTAPMKFHPAPVKQMIFLDLEKVNDELSYDETQPISLENEPKLYICQSCENLIRSMVNWSPDQGSDSPWKDPIDALRYLFAEPLFYVDPGIPECVGGRGWSRGNIARRRT